MSLIKLAIGWMVLVVVLNIVIWLSKKAVTQVKSKL